jgi:ParB family chromosome partitioning protein
MAAKSQRKGLGKGLSALMGDDFAPATEKMQGIEIVSISDIEPNPDQPRKRFTDEEIDGLAASLRAKGVLQPILVRPNPRKTTRYEIIAGERRWRAAQRAPLHEVPVLVQDFSDTETLEVALIENIQRVDLNAMEEAESYDRLMQAHGYTQEQLAEAVSKSRSYIANSLRLNRLHAAVAEALRAGDITAGHARALIGATDAPALVREIIAKGLSVREIERRVAPARKDKPGKPAEPAKDADTLALEGDLSAALQAQVVLKPASDGKGTIQITYKSFDHLDELCERFGL